MNLREYALDVLYETVRNDAFTADLLKEKPDLSDKDFKLAVKIIYGTLTNLSYLEYQYENLKRGKFNSKLSMLIDMTIYQLVFLRVPDYAAINESVNIAKKIDGGKFVPLVNGILRNYLRQGKREVTGQPIEVLSINTSLPVWLLKMWNAHYGQETMEKLAKMVLEEKNTCFRVREGYNRDELCRKIENSYVGKLTDCSLIIPNEPFNNEFFKQKQIVVQDQSSQLVSLFCEIKKGDSILDMCGAPGSKSLHLSELTGDTGSVLTCDLYPFRVKMMDKMIKDFNVKNIKTKVMDSTKASQELKDMKFDCVLLDAPCSGLGVLRDKPDMKLRISPEKIDEIVIIQGKLLEEAYKMMKDDGKIIYSTCTLNKKENEKQIEAFIKNHPDMMIDNQRTIFPFEYDCDGFYMARLIKKVIE